LALVSKPSVPAAVAAVISHNPAINECFKQKLLNYHALAAKIKPEVEKLTGKATTINTIVVAIARFSTSSAEALNPQPFLILKDARVTLASDAVDVTIKGKKSDLIALVKQLADLSSSLNEPAYVFQLSNSIKLIADDGEYISVIRPSLDKMLIAREATRLSRLDIRLPADVEIPPGFGLFLTELLYRQGIGIRHTYIGEETVLILGREDGPRAYETLRQEIDDARSTQSNQATSPRRSQSRITR
jgi:hypothetical protein